MKVRLIGLNAIQTLLYRHQPVEVLIRTTWKELEGKLACVASHN